MTDNKKPTCGGGPSVHLQPKRATFPHSLPPRRLPVNPHLQNLRAQAENHLADAEIAQDWPAYRRHYAVYLALLDIEAGPAGGGA
jgi:hypothetical protein